MTEPTDDGFAELYTAALETLNVHTHALVTTTATLCTVLQQNHSNTQLGGDTLAWLNAEKANGPDNETSRLYLVTLVDHLHTKLGFPPELKTQLHSALQKFNGLPPF